MRIDQIHLAEKSDLETIDREENRLSRSLINIDPVKRKTSRRSSSVDNNHGNKIHVRPRCQSYEENEAGLESIDHRVDTVFDVDHENGWAFTCLRRSF